MKEVRSWLRKMGFTRLVAIEKFEAELYSKSLPKGRLLIRFDWGCFLVFYDRGVGETRRLKGFSEGWEMSDVENWMENELPFLLMEE